MTDRRPLAAVGREHALAHLDPVVAVKGIAFDRPAALMPSRRKMCANAFITVVVPAPEEPVTAMTGCLMDMV